MGGATRHTQCMQGRMYVSVLAPKQAVCKHEQCIVHVAQNIRFSLCAGTLVSYDEYLLGTKNTG